MLTRQQLTLLRFILLVSIPLTALVLFRLVENPYQAGYLFKAPHWLAFLAAGCLLLLLEAVLFTISLSTRYPLLYRWQESGMNILRRLGRLNLLLFAATIAVFSFLVLGRYGYLFESMPLRLILFSLVTLAGLVLLRAAGICASTGELLAISLLFATFGYRLAAYLPEISSYPFTLNWSEASRYYYASLYFSERIYGLQVPPTVLHPSRYLMQSVPFLIPGSPIWLHRFWQVLLWTSISLAAAWAVARRVRPTGDPTPASSYVKEAGTESHDNAAQGGGEAETGHSEAAPQKFRFWMFVAWAFLFILIGPIYYHLLVPFVIVVLGYSSSKKHAYLWNLAIVLLASVWAGISRVNWFPVPAMLAAAIYFFEEPLGQRSLLKYLLYPLILGIAGTATAFASQAAYVWWSGNPPEQFASSLTSDLLWQRLLPNPTYPLGVLPAVLLVSVPILWLLGDRMAGKWRHYHPIRILGLAGMLLVLFTGGLVVSTKIGGGSNLHNMDAYLALLLLTSAYIYFDRFVPDSPLEQPERSRNPAPVAAVLGMTVLFTLLSGGPLHLPTVEKTQAALETIRKYVSEVTQDGGKVLLITERQLLTFGYLQGVELVPDYEKVFLMEMAMADNPEYLGRFNADLENKRFNLIISEPLFARIKDSSYIFGEENNAWVRNVSRPVLCYYKPVKFAITDLPVQVLLPRENQECKE